MIKYTNYLIFCSLLLLCCCKEITKSTRPSKDLTKKKPETTTTQKTAEETLRKNLTEEEQVNLDFLKESLNNKEKFNKFLLFAQPKIKEALAHIKTQLERCKNNNDGKEGFKNAVQAYFTTMDDNELANFKDSVTSTC